jgi:hypothetical protein
LAKPTGTLIPSPAGLARVLNFYSLPTFFQLKCQTSDGGIYEIKQWLSDESFFQLINETLSPSIGTGRMFNHFSAIPVKTASRRNIKVGASSDPVAIAFS